MTDSQYPCRVQPVRNGTRALVPDRDRRLEWDRPRSSDSRDPRPVLAVASPAMVGPRQLPPSDLVWGRGEDVES